MTDLQLGILENIEDQGCKQYDINTFLCNLGSGEVPCLGQPCIVKTLNIEGD